MRLYITRAGAYAGAQADAGKGFTQVEVPTDKAGLIAYLNGLAAESPVNAPPASEAPIPAPESPPRLGYTERSIQLDEDFDQLPLARQLDFAARAMENARERL